MKLAVRYAREHRKFLEQANPSLLQQLQSAGQLTSYLKEVGEQAEAMFETLEAQMVHAPDMPKEPRARIARLEQVPVVANELVMNDLILQPRPETQDA